MKRPNDYLDGPHDFWVHFWLGLVFGAGLGFFVFAELFESAWGLVAGVSAFALGMAYGCGRWGDRAWNWLLSLLS